MAGHVSVQIVIFSNEQQIYLCITAMAIGFVEVSHTVLVALTYHWCTLIADM